MDLVALLSSLGTVFLVEMPDATFLAILVLATRYRALLVWIGAAAAFTIQTGVAVALGTVATLLPRTPMLIIVGCLFIIGAVMLFREAREHQTDDDAEAEELAEAEQKVSAKAKPATGGKVIAISFVVLLFAEFGDLSHLLIISLVARYEAPIEVFSGALLALLIVAALAVTAGQALLKLIKLHIVFYLGAVLCLLLAAGVAWDVLTDTGVI